jgi:ferredoxin-thioredoxin reductase catalytic subunit
MTEIERLYDLLKKAQEPKGYYFNKDRERVNDLLSPYCNKERYGYGLPRLASGTAVGQYFCPCLGARMFRNSGCYCNLYVSRVERGKIPQATSRAKTSFKMPF